MTTFDFTPLYRSTIGFDHLASLLDSMSSGERGANSYPPCNIELLKDDHYRITMAVAGFADKDIDIEVANQTLTVASASDEKASERTYLHQGIAKRNFRRQFKLADHIQVVGASLENGLLHIDLKREVPEEMKPRRIAVNGKKTVPEMEMVPEIPAETSRSLSEGVRQSWQDPAVREARCARSRVQVSIDGKEPRPYSSLFKAFEALGLPIEKHIRFRGELKKEGKKDFFHNGVCYAFVNIPA